MTTTWSANELGHFASSEELEIAPRSADGSLRPFVPIWVVAAGDEVYVRTWHRRDNGWFGRVVDSKQARVRVGGLEADVAVEDVGADKSRSDVDDAYRQKYARYGDGTVSRMVTDDAAASTLRLVVGRRSGTSGTT
jgi:hypothetical protein